MFLKIYKFLGHDRYCIVKTKEKNLEGVLLGPLLILPKHTRPGINN